MGKLLVISLKVKVKREMHSRKSPKMQSVISFPELKEEVKVKILKCSLTKSYIFPRDERGESTHLRGGQDRLVPARSPGDWKTDEKGKVRRTNTKTKHITIP